VNRLTAAAQQPTQADSNRVNQAAQRDRAHLTLFGQIDGRTPILLTGVGTYFGDCTNNNAADDRRASDVCCDDDHWMSKDAMNMPSTSEQSPPCRTMAGTVGFAFRMGPLMKP